jgi:hypothetical protein
MLHQEMDSTVTVALQPESGKMIHSGWVIVASVGSGDYVVTLDADGLEASSSFELIQLVYLSGMSMSQATAVASASL